MNVRNNISHCRTNITDRISNTNQISQNLSFKGKQCLSYNTISNFKDSLYKLVCDTNFSKDSNEYNSITEYIKSVIVNMNNGQKVNFKLWQFPRYCSDDKTLIELNKKTSVIIDNSTGNIDKINKPWWLSKSKIYKKLELAIKTLNENMNNPLIVDKQRNVIITETQKGRDARAERDFYAFMHHG